MRSKFFLLSVLLIIFFVLAYLFPKIQTLESKPEPKSSSVAISTNSAALDTSQILYETARANLEAVNSTYNTLLTISLIILTILGLGVGIAALFTNERVKEIDRLLEDVKEKGAKVSEMIQNTENSLSNLPTGAPTDQPILTPTTPSGTDYSKVLQIAFFETIYRQIFGSQITILRMLKSSPNHTSSSALLEAIWRRSKFSDISFETYISFLTNATLITKSGDNYSITQPGLDFLNYLFENSIPDKIE